MRFSLFSLQPKQAAPAAVKPAKRKGERLPSPWKPQLEVIGELKVYRREIKESYALEHYPIAARSLEPWMLGRRERIVYTGYVGADDEQKLAEDPAFIPDKLSAMPADRWAGRVKTSIDEETQQEELTGPPTYTGEQLYNLAHAMPEEVKNAWGDKPSAWERFKVLGYVVALIAVLAVDLILFDQVTNPRPQAPQQTVQTIQGRK